MEWLVVWWLMVQTPIPCPDGPKQIDPENPFLFSSCAVYHCKVEKVIKTELFKTRIEADEFIEKKLDEKYRKRAHVLYIGE